MSLESIGQINAVPQDTLDSVALTEFHENQIGDKIVSAGWLVVTVGAVTTLAGWGIFQSGGEGAVVVGIGFGLVGVGFMEIAIGEIVKALAKKKGKKQKRRNYRKEHISELSATLCKLKSEVDDSTYYERIMRYSLDSNFYIIQLREQRYGNGKIKFIGLKSKHNYGKNPDYFYKIGTWQYFYSNGNIKKRIDYDLRENKYGLHEFYDKKGKLILQEQQSTN